MPKRNQYELDIFTLAESNNISVRKMIEDLEIRQTLHYANGRISPKAQKYKNILLAKLDPIDKPNEPSINTYKRVAYKFGIGAWRTAEIVVELHRLLHRKYNK